MKLDLIRLGEELAEENNAAHDLWTWLPSHSAAVKHHGDHADNYRPSNRDVMREAAMYLARQKQLMAPLSPEEKSVFMTCPCGEEECR